MPVAVTVRCKGALLAKFAARAASYGLSLNQYLKARMLDDVGELPDGFFTTRWYSDTRATFLRGK